MPGGEGARGLQVTAGQGARGRALHLGDGCANSGQVGDDRHPVLEEWERCLGGWLGGRQRFSSQRMGREVQGRGRCEKATGEPGWAAALGRGSELQDREKATQGTWPGCLAGPPVSAFAPSEVSGLCLHLSWGGECLPSPGRLSTLDCIGDSVSRHWV